METIYEPFKGCSDKPIWIGNSKHAVIENYVFNKSNMQINQSLLFVL